MDVVLYFIFHFVYVGNSTHLLAQLWLAYEHKHRLYCEVIESPWKMLSERAMESYHAIGVMVGVTHNTSVSGHLTQRKGGLIASVAIALLSFPRAENDAAQTLLFASLSGVFSQSQPQPCFCPQPLTSIEPSSSICGICIA